VDVVILQVFVSLMLVVGSILLFAFTCRQRDFDHADRLALLPLQEELPAARRDRASRDELPASPKGPGITRQKELEKP
jgi:hypothetical protein